MQKIIYYKLFAKYQKPLLIEQLILYLYIKNFNIIFNYYLKILVHFNIFLKYFKTNIA